MSALAEILERRARLLAEAEAQRHALAEGIAVCRSVLVVADRGIAWAGWLRARPYLVVAAAAAIAALPCSARSSPRPANARPDYLFFAWPSAEQGWSFEQRSPITPTDWISISMPGRAKLVTVMSALPG